MPGFGDAAHRAVGLAPAPRKYDRAGRVALIGEAAQALLRGELPEVEARLFLAGALTRWLATGGDLERDFLDVVQRGSHRTASRIWADLIADERRDANAGPTLPAPPPKASTK